MLAVTALEVPMVMGHEVSKFNTVLVCDFQLPLSYSVIAAD
jgi:hypothetical protein